MALVAPIRPYLIQITVDKSIGNEVTIPKWLQLIFTWFQTTSLIQFLVIVTVLQIILIIIETTARFSFSYITAKLGQLVVKDIRDYTYKNILQLPLSKFNTTPIGTLTTRTINDIESINEILPIPIFLELFKEKRKS